MRGSRSCTHRRRHPGRLRDVPRPLLSPTGHRTPGCPCDEDAGVHGRLPVAAVITGSERREGVRDCVPAVGRDTFMPADGAGRGKHTVGGDLGIVCTSSRHLLHACPWPAWTAAWSWKVECSTSKWPTRHSWRWSRSRGACPSLKQSSSMTMWADRVNAEHWRPGDPVPEPMGGVGSTVIAASLVSCAAAPAEEDRRCGAAERPPNPQAGTAGGPPVARVTADAGTTGSRPDSHRKLWLRT
jgi:hypothetical protein